MSTTFVNKAAQGTSYFTPEQVPASGTAVDKDAPTLFQPIKIRSVEFQNRIFLSPLCQYSAQNGVPTPWHMAHLGGIFTRGPGLTIVEASAVVPEGRITPEDAGIWNDEQADAWSKITGFAHSQNQKIAIQLAHAGRKASAVAPFLSPSAIAADEQGGWSDNVWGPSAIRQASTLAMPKELSVDAIKNLVASFVEAAKRSVKAGFDVIEIHGAHGYLISSFLSPWSNKRTDSYGGSFENRIRFPLEVVDAVRAVIPEGMPLFFRVSATDWLEEVHPNEPSWRSEDTVALAKILAERGVDFLDISSGGNSDEQKIKGGPAFQAVFAQAVKKELGDKLIVGTVGSINSGKIAQEVLDKKQADVVLVGRGFQKNPGLVWTFAEDLGVTLNVASQIGWGFGGRGQKTAKRKD